MAAKAKLVAAIETTSFKCCWTSLLSPPFRGSPQQTTEPSSRIAAWGEHHRLSPLKPKEKLIFWTKASAKFLPITKIIPSNLRFQNPTQKKNTKKKLYSCGLEDRICKNIGSTNTKVQMHWALIELVAPSPIGAALSCSLRHLEGLPNTPLSHP